MHEQDSSQNMGTLRQGQLLDFLGEQSSGSLRELLNDEVALIRRLCDYTTQRAEDEECDCESEQASEGAALYESRVSGAEGVWRRLSGEERDHLVAVVQARFFSPDVDRHDLDMILC